MPKKMDRYEFIWKAIQKHGYKYDYRKVNYINSQTKVCIICPVHGEFWITPNHHLQGKKCRKCYGNYRMDRYEFMWKSIQKHGYKYNYSKVKYINNREMVCIICPEHGEFYQTPHSHLSGKGCHKCCNTVRSTTKEFISKANEIHNNKYDYSKVKYINNKTKICIICPKHGEFWQRPNAHLSKKTNCPICHIFNLEDNVKEMLINNGINYIFQYRDKELLDAKSLDFYLPDYNIAIECQGRQHFEPIDFFGGVNGFKDTVERDEKKYKICADNNMTIFYYTDYDKKIKNDSIYSKENTFSNVKNLLKKIREG